MSLFIVKFNTGIINTINMEELNNINNPNLRPRVKLEYLIALIFLGFFTYGVGFFIALVGYTYYDSTNVLYQKQQYDAAFKKAKLGNNILLISIFVCSIVSVIIIFIHIITCFKAIADYLYP